MRLDEFTRAVVWRDGAPAIIRVLEVTQELTMGEILEDEAEAGGIAYGVIVIEALRSLTGRGYKRAEGFRLVRSEFQMRIQAWHC